MKIVVYRDYSYKNCDKDNVCHSTLPYKKNDRYYLYANQKPKEAKSYLIIDKDTAYIYYLDYFDEEGEPLMMWSKMEKTDTKSLTYQITNIHQVFGSDFLGHYNKEINQLLKTLIQKTGMLEIGDLPNGRVIKTSIIISFNQKNNDYEINCDKYQENNNNENIDDELPPDPYFYYQCALNKKLVYTIIQQ